MKRESLLFHEFGNKQGKPLVISHGWATDSLFTFPITKLFPERRLLLLDLPGYGLNKNNKLNPIEDNFVELLLNQIPNNCDLLSWSLSTLTAIKACVLDTKQKIDSLITVCGTPRFPSDPTWPGFSARYVMQTKALFTEHKSKRLLRLFYMLQCQSPLNSDEVNSFIKDVSAKMDMPNFNTLKRGLSNMADIDLRSDLKHLNIPSLHLYGAQDHLVPIEQSLFLNKFLNKNHYFYIFNKSGHMPFLTEPDKFREKINIFFKYIENN